MISQKFTKLNQSSQSKMEKKMEMNAELRQEILDGILRSIKTSFKEEIANLPCAEKDEDAETVLMRTLVFSNIYLEVKNNRVDDALKMADDNLTNSEQEYLPPEFIHLLEKYERAKAKKAEVESDSESEDDNEE